jgi:hypothetical protein
VDGSPKADPVANKRTREDEEEEKEKNEGKKAFVEHGEIIASVPRSSPWQGDATRPWRPLSPVEQALLR